MNVNRSCCKYSFFSPCHHHHGRKIYIRNTHVYMQNLALMFILFKLSSFVNSFLSPLVIYHHTYPSTIHHSPFPNPFHAKPPCPPPPQTSISVMIFVKFVSVRLYLSSKKSIPTQKSYSAVIIHTINSPKTQQHQETLSRRHQALKTPKRRRKKRTKKYQARLSQESNITSPYNAGGVKNGLNIKSSALGLLL